MDEKSREADLQKLQAMEQALHTQVAQRNAYQSQLLEIENASKELGNSPESYRIIGNIMVKTDSATLQKDLNEKKELLQTRITSVDRQEKKLREEMERIQKSILGA